MSRRVADWTAEECHALQDAAGAVPFSDRVVVGTGCPQYDPTEPYAPIGEWERQLKRSHTHV